MQDTAEKLLEICRAGGLKIAAAESCTGGMIAAALTDIAGSSDVFDRGFVTYSNVAKIELLDVSEALIAEHGAVSEAVARAMAEGALKHSEATISVSVTGIAGPSGGTEEKPVGLVYIGSASKNADTLCEKHVFDGGRHAVRMAATQAALNMLCSRTKI